MSDGPDIKVPSGEDPKMTKAVKRGVKICADELGADWFRDGSALFVFAIDRKGHISIAAAGHHSLEQTEMLVKAAEQLRARRSS